MCLTAPVLGRLPFARLALERDTPVIDLQALRALYDQELRVGINYPEARKEMTARVVRFVREAPGMNFVSYGRLDAATLDDDIAEQVAYFRQWDQPFSWHVYAHDQPANLAERLVAHGFELDDQADVMVLDLQSPPAALLAPLQVAIRQITQREQLSDVIGVMERVWGGDFGWIWRRLGGHMEIPGYLNIYMADVDGQPASAAWVYFYPGSRFAGLFGGSTVPELRGRGLYTALLAARAQEAIRRGYRFLTIDAGEMSRPIVAGHGFQQLTQVFDYLWKG
jgi:GNAT superfamily N-acetyltransferase